MKKQLIIAALAGLFATSTAVAATDSLVDRQGEFVRDRQNDCVLVKDGVPGCGIVIQDLTFSADTFFDFDKATIRPQGRELLNKVAAELVKNAADVRSIELTGHTDSTGSATYNQGLSDRRANAVRNYLIEKGVNPSVITAKGEGISYTFDNATAEGRAKNRRVDVKITAVREVKVD
ncbi:MAG TPA: OmpA family protein [Candidatus Ignatzschineria merdigallinarum]|uniref:OmpA family protein n=1 Tax=Candidatus Ignatzschineria merdigallinarum TaxID=2838621 RepID=A0A9D1TUQ6_9GAMM|nr:OmpA family protein [Candidatus Ignatzschineria merdigallinarum]